MKRSLFLLLTATLLLTSLLLPALSLRASAGTAAKTTISAKVRSTEILYTGSTSDAFRVAIDLSLGKDEPGIAVYVVTVRWDPNVLDLIVSSDSYKGTGCYFTDAFSDGWEMIPDGTTTVVNTADVSKGKITVTSGSAENRARSDGTLFVLRFRPRTDNVSTDITVTPGSSNVSVSAALSSASGKITNVEAETKLTLNLRSAPEKRGDVDNNGAINALDYLLIKRHVLGTFKLSDVQLIVADVNRDGRLNALDYMLLKRHVLGTYVIT